MAPPSNKRRRLDDVHSVKNTRVTTSSSSSVRESKKGNPNKKLLDELYRLKSENSRLLAKGKADSLTISTLSNEKQRLLDKCTEYRTKKQILKKAKAESQQQLQDCQAEVSTLQEEVGTLKDRKKLLMQKLKDTRAKIESLQQYAVASDQSITDTNHQNQIIQDKNKALDAENNALEAKVETLGRENETLLKQCKEEQHAKEALICAKNAIQEKYYTSEEALDLIRMQLEVSKSQSENFRVHLGNATKTIHTLQHCVRERDCFIERVQDECDQKLHGLHVQSHKSLIGIQNSNQILKKRVGELEGLLAHDAKCMKGLFEERDELQRKVFKQQEKTVVFKSEVEDQLRSTLQQHRDALTQVEARLEKGSETKSNGELIRDKNELKRIIADMKAKHEEEVEALQEEIEQTKMNHALEMGFVEG